MPELAILKAQKVAKLVMGKRRRGQQRKEGEDKEERKERRKRREAGEKMNRSGTGRGEGSMEEEREKGRKEIIGLTRLTSATFRQ